VVVKGFNDISLKIALRRCVIPELPEVETIVRGLRATIMGRVIVGLVVRDSIRKRILKTDPFDFYQGVINETVVTVLRKGKYIIMPLSNDNVLVMHLGMTGKLLLEEPPDVPFDERFSGDDHIDKHTHLIMELIDPSGDDAVDLDLCFNDYRMFGKIWLLENVASINELDVPGLRDLGPDALAISLPDFRQTMSAKRAVKAVLLDQTKIAGVGNIYADEACFAAGVHPATKGRALDDVQLSKLWFSVKTVLKQGIKFGGSSTSDYVTTDGSAGSFQNYHRVYGKEGQNCVDCNSTIRRIKLAGRSTHFCPSCQMEEE
jgi:formamidopyrimidine-DNA glycosylase